MSRPLAPRSPQDSISGGSRSLQPPVQRPRKISNACSACQQRKTKCSGSEPCEACVTRNSPCVYDALADQRRKIANQRNIDVLNQTQHVLTETQHELRKTRHLLGGVLATIRASNHSTSDDLISLIRSGVDLSQLAAFVRNEMASNPSARRELENIIFVIDGPEDLPSSALMIGSTGGGVGAGSERIIHPPGSVDFMENVQHEAQPGLRWRSSREAYSESDRDGRPESQDFEGNSYPRP